MQIRDRIVELRRVRGSELRPNPKNWRTHPKRQADALRGVLAEIGIADACIARELPDGSLMLIDGHLRTETLANELVPVLVLDVSEEEADKILVTLDPLAGMAGADAELLGELAARIKTDSEALQGLIDETLENARLIDEMVDEQNEAFEEQNPYTAKTDVPTYKVTGDKPSIVELYDDAYCQKLLSQIAATNLPEQEKEFLKLAAYRHVVFNFERIAEYYAHSNAAMQGEMESSALVIVDIADAIANGWAQLNLELDTLTDDDLAEQPSDEQH
jgi:hypothetical protein